MKRRRRPLRAKPLRRRVNEWRKPTRVRRRRTGGAGRVVREAAALGCWCAAAERQRQRDRSSVSPWGVCNSLQGSRPCAASPRSRWSQAPRAVTHPQTTQASDPCRPRALNCTTTRFCETPRASHSFGLGGNPALLLWLPLKSRKSSRFVVKALGNVGNMVGTIGGSLENHYMFVYHLNNMSVSDICLNRTIV